MNKSGEENNLSLPERHGRILALLQQYGSISVTQLSERFRVSEVTIRKDLSFLEQQKKLYRTHGSAILISPYISDGRRPEGGGDDGPRAGPRPGVDRPPGGGLHRAGPKLYLRRITAPEPDAAPPPTGSHRPSAPG